LLPWRSETNPGLGPDGGGCGIKPRAAARSQLGTVHLFLALLPLFRGELKEGLGLVLEAEKLDPLSPIISYVATAAYLADKRIDEAIIAGQRTQRLDPHYFYLDSNLAAAYREKGNFAEAIALYTKAQEEQRFPSSGLAITYARMGQQAEAKKILDQLLQERQPDTSRRRRSRQSTSRSARKKKLFAGSSAPLPNTVERSSGSHSFPSLPRSVPTHVSRSFCGESALRTAQFWRLRKQLW
jgi:Putative Zn-dependent protease, contains TPR repeats